MFYSVEKITRNSKPVVSSDPNKRKQDKQRSLEREKQRKAKNQRT